MSSSSAAGKLRAPDQRPFRSPLLSWRRWTPRRPSFLSPSVFSVSVCPLCPSSPSLPTGSSSPCPRLAPSRRPREQLTHAGRHHGPRSGHTPPGALQPRPASSLCWPTPASSHTQCRCSVPAGSLLSPAAVLIRSLAPLPPGPRLSCSQGSARPVPRTQCHCVLARYLWPRSLS